MITLMDEYKPSAAFERAAALARTVKPTVSTWQTFRRALDMLTDDEVRRLPAAWISHWPDDLSRPPATNWTGRNPRLVFARSVHEVDLYNTYRIKIAQAFGQDAYLSRQFTGACVPKSRIEVAIKLLFKGEIKGAVKVLRGGEFTVGDVGQADLGGFLILVVNRPGRAPVRVPVPLHVEVKVKGGTEDEHQTTRREALLRKGICAILADDVDGAIAQIKEYKDRWEQILS